MTTDIRNITSTPSMADSVPCWECSGTATYEQATRTATGWRAIICKDCEGWVAGLLGPIFTGER